MWLSRAEILLGFGAKILLRPRTCIQEAKQVNMEVEVVFPQVCGAFYKVTTGQKCVRAKEPPSVSQTPLVASSDIKIVPWFRPRPDGEWHVIDS